MCRPPGGHIWNWMRGAPTPQSNGASSNDYLAHFNGQDQAARLQSVYAAAGPSQVAGLADALLASAGQNKHERALGEGSRRPAAAARRRARLSAPLERTGRGDGRRHLRALGLRRSGDPGLAAAARTLGSLDTDQRRLRLGRDGPRGEGMRSCAGGLVGEPAQSSGTPDPRCLGGIGEGIGPALPQIERLLTQTQLDWQEAQVMRGWVAEDQVRMNATSRC